MQRFEEKTYFYNLWIFFQFKICGQSQRDNERGGADGLYRNNVFIFLKSNKMCSSTHSGIVKQPCKSSMCVNKGQLGNRDGHATSSGHLTAPSVGLLTMLTRGLFHVPGA